MPYQRPTLTQLIAEVAADIKAALPSADPLLRRSVLNVLARIQAGLHHEQMGYLDWIARMAVPGTSADEFLEFWAALKGVRRAAAQNAVVSVGFTGNPLASIAAPASLIRIGDGATYTAPVGATAAGDGTLSLTAVADIAGSSGTPTLGSTLQLQSPAAGINSTGTVLSIVTDGTDIETNDSLMGRMLLAYQAPPHGGDLDDYVEWARAVPGVTRAWCADSLAGTGTVTVYFMMDMVRSYQFGLPAGGNGVSQNETRAAPAIGDQLAVADSLYTRRAATALLYACAPAPAPLQITLQEVPADPLIRGAIGAAISGLCIRSASPGGAWLSPSRTKGGILRLSALEGAIAAVPGLDHFVVAQPTGDVVSSLGVISVPGTITYQNPS